jgi:hypothetical protein
MAISGLGLKITTPIVLISGLAIALTAFLNLGKFQRTFTELEQSRLQFVVNDLRTNLETGLALGLPIKSLANAQAVIEFEAKKDPAILSISVYDETGTVVFHTGQTLVTATVPTTWKPAANGKGERHWQLNEPGALVVGTALSGIIGAQSGGLALRYSRQSYDNVVRSVSNALTFASILGVCTTALIAIFGINLLVGRTKNKLSRIENALDRAAQTPGTADKQTDPEMRTLVNNVIISSQKAMQDLTASQEKLRNTLRDASQVETK